MVTIEVDKLNNFTYFDIYCSAYTTMAAKKENLKCLQDQHKNERWLESDFNSQTLDEQIKIEASVASMFQKFCGEGIVGPKLHRDRHVSYLKSGLKHLSESFCCLDASRPWLVYWAVHALELLGESLNEAEACSVVTFLKLCQCPDGGFGGGPGQYPHLAPTYAAVNALVIIGTNEAYDAIDRENLTKFLWSMKCDDGSFQMNEGGEIDIRGVYCAVSVSRLTNLPVNLLFEGTPQWIMECQTYEGGFSGAPGLEAHGGYTFCGLAALTLLRAQHLCHTQALLRWAVNRQMRFEGGFQGRTNKLVDGCYSFWQGGLFPMLHSLLTQEGTVSGERWLFDQEALQEYLLLCCQHVKGGLIDKPGKGPDLYHTCYTLSGMSIAQHFSTASTHTKYVVGSDSNELTLIHPLFNIGFEAQIAASHHFKMLPVPSIPNCKAEAHDGC